MTPDTGSAPGCRESVLWPHCPSTALLVGSEPSQTQWDDGSFRRRRKPDLLHAGAPKVRRPSDNCLGLPFTLVSWLRTLRTLILPFHAVSTPFCSPVFAPSRDWAGAESFGIFSQTQPADVYCSFPCCESKVPVMRLILDIEIASSPFSPFPRVFFTKHTNSCLSGAERCTGLPR